MRSVDNKLSLIHICDDWVDPDMYEKLYIKAREDNADIVMCDYYEEKQGKRIRCSQNPFKNGILKRMVQITIGDVTFDLQPCP